MLVFLDDPFSINLDANMIDRLLKVTYMNSSGCDWIPRREPKAAIGLQKER